MLGEKMGSAFRPPQAAFVHKIARLYSMVQNEQEQFCNPCNQNRTSGSKLWLLCRSECWSRRRCKLGRKTHCNRYHMWSWPFNHLQASQLEENCKANCAVIRLAMMAAHKALGKLAQSRKLSCMAWLLSTPQWKSNSIHVDEGRIKMWNDQLLSPSQNFQKRSPPKINDVNDRPTG